MLQEREEVGAWSGPPVVPVLMQGEGQGQVPRALPSSSPGVSTGLLCEKLTQVESVTKQSKWADSGLCTGWEAETLAFVSTRTYCSVS